MRGLLAGGLATGLLAFVTGAPAQEWRPVGAGAQPSAGIRLHRPMPLHEQTAAPPRVDHQLRPITYSTQVRLHTPQPIVRAKIDMPQPLPAGTYPVGQVIPGEPSELRSSAEPLPMRPSELPGSHSSRSIVGQPGPMCLTGECTTIDGVLVPCDDPCMHGGMVDGGVYYGDAAPLDCNPCPGGMCDTYGMHGGCHPGYCHDGSCQPGYGPHHGPCCLWKKLFGCGHGWGHDCPPGQYCGHDQHGHGHWWDGHMYGDCGGYRRPCFWIGAEYIRYRLSDQEIQPILGDAGAVVFGADQLNEQERESGARVFLGFWFCQSMGFDANWFSLGRETTNFNFDGTFDVLPIGGDDILNPRITTTQYLWGADANLRKKLINRPNCYFDLLIGYRHLQLSESIALDGTVNDAAALARSDTTNRFHGGQVGFDTEYRFAPRWSLGGMVKVAIGSTQQRVRLQGNGNFIFTEGVSNADRNVFTMVPEAQVRLTHDVSDRWRVYVAYNILASTNVVRPSNQINVLNNVPAVLIRDEGFIAHGLNVGLMCTY